MNINSFELFEHWKVFEKIMQKDKHPYIIIWRCTTNNDGYRIGKYDDILKLNEALEYLISENNINFDISAMRKEKGISKIIHGLD